MSALQGLKLESTLVFPESGGKACRYEILQDLDTNGRFGAHIYLLKYVEGHEKEMPFNTKLAGAPTTRKVQAWVFAKGINCENCSLLSEAETFVREYHNQNWLSIRSSLHPL
ncbi:TPA: hypothetical protein RRG91_000171 [Klebsiella pneumoniae]|nr:hypothetical protein [Klebsiella pneumoniae]